MKTPPGNRSVTIHSFTKIPNNINIVTDCKQFVETFPQIMYSNSHRKSIVFLLIFQFFCYTEAKILKNRAFSGKMGLMS